VVVGAGVAGLGAALALGRSGHEVVMVERDDIGAATDPEEAFAERGRPGAPQTRHSHAFLARLRRVLVERAPDVLAGLLDAGATELRFLEDLPPEMESFDPEPGDAELVALACRRTTFEWVLRSYAMADWAVTLVHGAAAGLELDGRRVRGVRLSDGTALPADAILDCTGRRTPLSRWLSNAGAVAPPVTSAESGIVYSTRFYRLRPDAVSPPQEGPIGGDLGYMKYAIFPADNRTFSITFAVPSSDPDLRVLFHDGPFDRATEAMPATARWVTGHIADPITGVEVMARLVNRKADFVVDGHPLVTGLFAVGDSHVCTNPLYGRGCALALVHAFLLADVLADHGPASVDAALAFDAATATELVPWYDAAVAQDGTAAGAEDAAAGAIGAAGSTGSARPGNLIADGLLPAARRDQRVLRAFLRSFNLLDPPRATLADPYVVAKVMEAFQERHHRPRTRLGPERDELLAAVAA
jgi:2-polyprenyl-6-methoxyphenol hydroxylase-like FAD-dependent oxidoreductase